MLFAYRLVTTTIATEILKKKFPCQIKKIGKNFDSYFVYSETQTFIVIIILMKIQSW